MVDSIRNVVHSFRTVSVAALAADEIPSRVVVEFVLFPILNEVLMKLLGVSIVPLLLASGIVFAEEPDPPPDVKAQIKLHTTTLHTSKKSAERAKAAAALGALGAPGKLACRDLCQAMMDSSPAVRTAAADALQKIDEPLYKLATAIFINVDVKVIMEVQKEGAKAEPLTPLILKVAGNSLLPVPSMAGRGDGNGISQCVKIYRECIVALSEIATSDPGANKLLIGSINFQLPLQAAPNKDFQKLLQNESWGVRALAIRCVVKMANVKQAFKQLSIVASSDVSKNRIAAIALLAEIVDNDNKATIKKTLEAIRFDADPNVRQAVDAALKKLNSN